MAADFHIKVIVDPGPAVAGSKKVEVSLDKAEGAADRLQESLVKAFSTDVNRLLGGFAEFSGSLSGVLTKLDQAAAGQARVSASTEQLLRQMGDLAGAAKGAGDAHEEAGAGANQQAGAEERLAAALNQVISELDQENRLLALNSRERDIQRRILAEVARLERTGGQVTASQRAQVEAAVRHNQALRDQAVALERIRGPQQQYQNQLAALRALLSQGQINTREYERAVRDLDKQLHSSTGAERLRNTLLGIVGIVGIRELFRELTQLADAYTLTQNRLRTVVAEEAQLAAVTAEVFDISNRTRSALQSTVEVYSRVGLAAKELGRSQQELLNFTESLNQAVILSGASATEAQAGLIQLSQGIASGALRGDELRSVLEQLPVVADVIAKSLGVSRGELRALGAEGKISAEVVLNAFKEAREELTERFAKSVPTVGQSLVVLRNSVTEFIGGLDQAAGTSAGAAGAILLLANNLEIAAAVGLAFGAATIPALIKGLSVFIGQGTVIKSIFNAGLFNPAVLSAAALGAAIVLVIDHLEDLQREQLKVTEQGEKFQLTEFGKVGADIVRVQENLRRVNEQIDRDIRSKGFANPAAVNEAQKYERQLTRLREEQERVASGTAKSAAEARKQVQAMEDLAKAVEGVVKSLDQEATLLGLNSRERENQKRLLDEVAKLEKERDVDVTDAQKADLLASIQRNQALQDQATALDEIRGPQLEFEARLTALQALLEQDKISTEEFNKAVGDLAVSAEGVDFSKLSVPSFSGTDALATLQATIDATQRAAREEAARAQALRDIRGPIEDLTAKQAALQQLLDAEIITQSEYTAELAEVAEAIRLLNPEYARQVALLQELEGPTRQLEERQRSLNALYATGRISLATYAAELARIHQALNPLSEEERRREALLQEIKGPQEEFALRLGDLNHLYQAGKISLEEYNHALDELSRRDLELGTSFGDGIASGLDKVGRQMTDIASLSEAVLVNAFNSAEDALVEFATTGKFSFEDFAAGILKDIARVISRMLILQAVSAATGVPVGALGQPGALSGALGFAKGGPFDAGQSMIVGEKGPELVRFGAPGIVTPAGQTDAALRAGGGGGTTVVAAPAPEVKVNVINVDSPDSARDAMDSDEGGRVILNQIRKNRSAIRRELN